MTTGVLALNDYHPYRHAERLGVTIVRAIAPGPARAWWVPAHDAILLDERLGQTDSRCALAHELAHIELGHTGCNTSWLNRKLERPATRFAALKLITLEQLMEVDTHGRSWADVADDLWVDVPTLRARVDCLTDAQLDQIDLRVAAREWGAA